MNPVMLRGLTYAYGEGDLRRQVLRDVNLDVREGEIVLLTGPSGSGKTTLLTLIGALRAMQDGSALVLGEELANAAEPVRVRLRRRIGFIFQNHNLLGFLTARQNVAMALEQDGGLDERARLARAGELLAAVDESRRLRLPLLPGNRSLNLSNAVAVLVFEAWRQHGFAGGV